MPKFKVGDRIKDAKDMSNNATVVAEITAINGPQYMLKLVVDTLHNRVNAEYPVIIKDIDLTCILVESPKPVISDCFCNSWLLLHKGCICGYSKALGSKFGLAHAA